VFYYMETDFLNKPPSPDKRPLYLYTIDAATGKGKQQVRALNPCTRLVKNRLEPLPRLPY